MLVKVGGSWNGSATLTIDPARRFIHIGESRHFNTGLNPAQTKFVDNLVLFIGNGAAFGSHFLDLFIEPGHKSDRGEPAGPAAPYDKVYWGENAGVDSPKN
jgi:hypothetical protein